MDKLSTKLKLVRSQSMGVGMGGGGDKLPTTMGVRRTTGAASANPGGAASVDTNGRMASIVLLDERRLEMLIQPRLFAGELLDLVASHIQLKEKEYFGLAVVDENGHYTWLQLDRKILDHDLPRKPSTLHIHFLVKFFIESICHLADNKTIELFYMQARGLIFRGTLEVEADIVFQLAALSLQASNGDHVDEATTRSLIRKSPVLPAHVLREHESTAKCEEHVISFYVKTKGQTRGQAMVNYMTIVESMPTYGVHYFEVLDKRGSPWWLGLSCRGIAQYEAEDRKTPVRVFQWKQLENLYFRDKKFSIEVHDAKRVVQTLSSFNLYEDVNKNGHDLELAEAISEATTQVSLSRRSYNPGNIHVYVWFGKTQTLTKCIWQSAISQHQFYLDRKQAKMRPFQLRTLKEIARDLTRSSLSLSSNSSSVSNLSQTFSESTVSLMASKVSLKSVQHTDQPTASTSSLAGGAASTSTSIQTEEQIEEAKRLKVEMLAALKARREALEAKLKEKNGLLKELCIKEGELTGELPPEIPLNPGEPVPTIRKRVGTEFKLSEHLFVKTDNAQDSLRASLELELEIQNKITAAAYKLLNDPRAPKGVRKQRKHSYQQSLKRLQELEVKLKQPPSNDKSAVVPKRGISIPADLEKAADDEVDALVKSCPSSPRKKAEIMSSPQHQRQSSYHNSRGYVPSSSAYKSSYRSKQFPTFAAVNKSPAVPGIDAHLGLPLSPPTNIMSNASPYRSKYEVPNLQLDSPVGLYNCPQQRTSQAFSSMDDLDALTASYAGKIMRPQNSNTSSVNIAAMNHRYVLGQAREVMARVEAATASVLSGDKYGKRELPALPAASASSSLKALESRSMENLDALGSSRSKLHYREINNSHNLHNTEEYPPHEMSRRPSRTTEEPLPPLPPSQRAASTTLLPGQTYPEQLPSKPISDVFYRMTTTSNVKDSNNSSSSSSNSQAKSSSDSPPPPLYPKQYHAVVEQRRRSGLDRPTAVAVPAVIHPAEENQESPAVDRRIKPKMGEDSLSNTSFEGTTDAAAAFKYVPYMETTKPFEMSDFYKYSTKFKKGGGSSESSISSNDNNNSKPPELPAKNSPAKGQPPPPPPPPPSKAVKATATAAVILNEKNIGDSFSSEMLQWYNKQGPRKGHQTTANHQPKCSPAEASSADKPATLV